MWGTMKMTKNPVIYEVILKQYQRAILNISRKKMHRNLKINFFYVHQTNQEQNYFDCVILTEFNRSDRTWIFSWSKMGFTSKFRLCGARFNAHNGRHRLSATAIEWMAMKPERVLSYMSLLPAFLSFYSYLPIKKSNWH